MTFENRIATIYDYFAANYGSYTSADYWTWPQVKADVLANIQTAELGEYLLKWSQFRGDTPQTEEIRAMSLRSLWTKLYSYSYYWSGSSWTEKLEQNSKTAVYKAYFCLTTVSKIADYLPSSVYNPDRGTYTSKETFLNDYGDYLCLDFINRPEPNDSTQLYTPYIDVGAKPTLGSFMLKIGDSYLPLADWWDNGASSLADYHYLTGRSAMRQTFGAEIGVQDLYDCYYCIDHSEQNWEIKESLYLQTTKGHVSRLFRKDVVDEIIEDLKYLGLEAEYTDSSLNPPAEGPKLTALSVLNADSFTPTFDSDVFEYAVSREGNYIEITATGDENTVKIGVTDEYRVNYTWSDNVENPIFRILNDDQESVIYYVVAEDANQNQTEYQLTITRTISGPRITHLTVMNGEFEEPFASNNPGPYTILTTNSTIVYDWNENELVTSRKINDDTLIGTVYTFRNLPFGYTDANITVLGENNTSFTYNIKILRQNPQNELPRLQTVRVVDKDTGKEYNCNPNPTKNVYNYDLECLPTAHQLNCHFYFFVNLAGNHYKVNGYDYNEGERITVGFEEGRAIILNAWNEAGAVEYKFTMKGVISQNTNPKPGEEIPGTGGTVISGSKDVENLLDKYPPGFYGGSYIPTWRYVTDIYTTANGNYDFENDYSNRESGNETAIAALNSIINSYTIFGNVDAIVEAFIHYSNFINDDSGEINWRYVLPAINVSILRPLTLTKENIIPKNKKCYIYPFCELELNGYGTNSELAYEEFSHNQGDFEGGRHKLEFDILCKWFAGASIQLVPVNFQHIEDNFDYAVAGPEMPVFPYTKDDYLNEYYASRNTRAQALEAARQNATLNNVKAAVGIITGVGDSVVKGQLASQKGEGPSLGAILSGIGAVANGALSIIGNEMQVNQLKKSMAAELKDTANRPATVSNQNASPSISMVMKDAACPFIVHKAIRPEFMKKVDKFFTRFGYRTNRTGIPNIYKRPNFAYLECKNAVIGGNIPAEDKQKLKAIMEHGITFWHYGSTNFAGVGEYKDSDLTYNAPTYS